ncbi:hypothetical protein [Streptomyces pseudovenezuelae]
MPVDPAAVSCCGHLLATLGLNSLYPEVAARVLARPALWMQSDL